MENKQKINLESKIIMLTIHFKLDSDDVLFTTYDYKKLLEMVGDHFLIECTKQGLEVDSAFPYYNPGYNLGCVEYAFSNYDGVAYISDMEYPLADTMYVVSFT